MFQAERPRRLCEMYKSEYKLYVFCDQCDDTLTKRFHHDGKILICLFSFTILNIFENKRGLVKILVYSFVFDTYNQISVIFFAINIIITSG